MALTANAYQTITVDNTKYPTTAQPTRVPAIGSDNGTWGNILNNLLATSMAVTNANGPSGATQGFLTNVYYHTNITAAYVPALYPGEVIIASATAGNLTVTLPNATQTLNLYTVKKVDSTANTVTINPSNSQSIEGNAATSGNVVINTQYVSVTFVSDGTQWWII